MSAWLLRHLAITAGVVAVTAAIAFWIPRWARPDLFPGEGGLDGTLDAMNRAFLHFDFGEACGWPGCPPVSEMFARGYAADIAMLLGTLAIGVGGGFALGLWCAARTGSRRARWVENGASLLYCAPVYVIALGSLLLFHETFGVLPLPYFFHAFPTRATPFDSPWDWFRTLLVPWLITAAPLAAMCMRLVAAITREHLYAEPVQTALAKGVSHKRAVRRHAGPFARTATLSQVGVSAPIIVTNLILVEHCFSVQGFFLHTWKATGHSDNPRWPPFIDYEMLTAIAIWGSVFVVIISLAVEAALSLTDPRLRALHARRS